jgi:hypothetical protein
MAIVLQEPNNARARPSTLINKDVDYERVFNQQHPIAMYLDCARYMRWIDSFLASTAAPDYVRNNEINVRYQLAMFAAALKARKQFGPKDVPTLDLLSISDSALGESLSEVWTVFTTMRDDQSIEGDRVSKSPEFDRRLLTRLNELFAI